VHAHSLCCTNEIPCRRGLSTADGR
jgi:hypothetical protein